MCPFLFSSAVVGKFINLVNCVLSCLSCVWLFATLWPVGHQIPPSIGFTQARILELVAMPSSRWSSKSEDQSCLCLLPWQVDSLPLASPEKPDLVSSTCQACTNNILFKANVKTFPQRSRMVKDSCYHHPYDFLLLLTLLWCNWYI